MLPSTGWKLGKQTQLCKQQIKGISALKPLESTNQTESALAKVARVGMLQFDLETVEAAALAAWYGSVVPDLENVKGPHKKEALFCWNV